jgi:long-chain fatty acid transport protein
MLFLFHVLLYRRVRASEAAGRRSMRSFERRRDPRLPDEDRYWFCLGATYRPSPASRFDVGYTFIHVKDADIDNDQSARARGIVRGRYEGTVNILSLPYQHSF